MHDRDLLKARRDQARSHPVRIAILALAAQGNWMDPEDLHQELPNRPPLALIEYHLLVLRQVGLLPPPPVH